MNLNPNLGPNLISPCRQIRKYVSMGYEVVCLCAGIV